MFTMAGILTRRCKVLKAYCSSRSGQFSTYRWEHWRCNVAVVVNTEMPQKELKIIAGKEAHAALVKTHLKPPPFSLSNYGWRNWD